MSKLKGLQKLREAKADSGAQAGKKRKTSPDVALIGMGGTIAAVCLFFGAIYEVNNEGSNTTLIGVFAAFALLVSILCWYMGFLRRQAYLHKTNLDVLKKKVIKAKLLEKKTDNKKPVQEVQQTVETQTKKSQFTTRSELPPEIFEPTVLPPSSSDDIVMGFSND